MGTPPLFYLTSSLTYVILYTEVIKMKSNITKAKIHLGKLRQLISKRKTHFSGMSEEEVIKAIRKTREKLWEEKLAGHRT